MVAEGHRAEDRFPRQGTAAATEAVVEALQTQDRAGGAAAGGRRGMGGRGNDTITGGALWDQIEGNEDDDQLRAGADGGAVFGQDGDDRLWGASADDILLGGMGRDTIEGQAGADLILGGGGNDRLVGDDEAGEAAGDGADWIQGEEGNDTLLGRGGADLLEGGVGDDNLSGGSGDDTLLGGDHNDSLAGESGLDVLDGGAGDDTLSGGDGIDTLLGGLGRDQLAGGNEDDSLKGDAGSDVLKGDAGADSLEGGSEADSLFGGAGNDLLKGDSGKDELEGDLGDDTLHGGDDNDLLYGGSSTDTPELPSGDGNDELRGEQGNDELWGGDGRDTLWGGEGNDLLMGDDTNDPAQNKLKGSADVLRGGKGSDTLFGGLGDDFLYADGGDGGNENPNAAINPDAVPLDADGFDRLVGGYGNDLLVGRRYYKLTTGPSDPAAVYNKDATKGTVFVLAPGSGTDTILFFQSNKKVVSEDGAVQAITGAVSDVIQLTNGLSFSFLTIIEEKIKASPEAPSRYGDITITRDHWVTRLIDSDTNQVLAQLVDVRKSQLGRDNIDEQNVEPDRLRFSTDRPVYAKSDVVRIVDGLVRDPNGAADMESLQMFLRQTASLNGISTTQSWRDWIDLGLMGVVDGEAQLATISVNGQLQRLLLVSGKSTAQRASNAGSTTTAEQLQQLEPVFVTRLYRQEPWGQWVEVLKVTDAGGLFSPTALQTAIEPQGTVNRSTGLFDNGLQDLKQVSARLVDVRGDGGLDLVQVGVAVSGPLSGQLVVAVHEWSSSTQGFLPATPVALPNVRADATVDWLDLNDDGKQELVLDGQVFLYSAPANTWQGQGAAGTELATGTAGSTVQPGAITVLTTNVVNLSVSAAAVPEDGSSNLIFTISRSGSTAADLTVNYRVGGTARNGSDFSGIASTGDLKTITFAAGTSSAFVVVDPAADALAEADETVALTLAPGTGYVLGTSTRAEARISNDDAQPAPPSTSPPSPPAAAAS